LSESWVRLPNLAETHGGLAIRIFIRVVVLCALSSEPQALIVVTVGDSITAGALSDPMGPSYPDILGEVYDVVNIGCGGTTSRDWSPDAAGAFPWCGDVQFAPPYADQLMPLLPADVVTVLLGTNDALGFYEPAPIPVEDYALLMESLVLAALADGADKVIVMAPPQFPDNDGPENVHIEGYRSAVRELCTPGGDNIICGPDWGELLDPDEHFGAGNFHPNGPAHALIAEELIALVPEPGQATLLAAALATLGALRRSIQRRG
jgi:lysophospholipase L1-like esterase